VDSTFGVWWRSLVPTRQRSTGRTAGILVVIWIFRRLACPHDFLLLL